MLMTTVRASIRSVAPLNRPAKALQLAEYALLPDLDNSESFVTLFHAQLLAKRRTLNFVDRGYGYVFLCGICRRSWRNSTTPFAIPVVTEIIPLTATTRIGSLQTNLGPWFG